MIKSGGLLGVRTLGPVLLRAAICMLAALPLTGCLDRSEPISPKTVLPLPGLNSSVSNLAVTDIEGMDERTGNRLRAHLKTALAEQRITLVPGGKGAAFSLKGYGSINKDGRTATLVNIWDVLDVKGRRVHRIISEASGPASPAGDPWASVNSTLLAKSAKTLAAQYSAWSRGKPLTRPVKIARPAAPLTTAAIRTPAIRKPAARTPVRREPAEGTPISRAVPVSARFSGAPGNGNGELARALRAALHSRGYRLSAPSEPAVYHLNVTTSVGAAKAGRRGIAIDWAVSGRNGRPLGTVKQRNHVSAAALRRGWRPTADKAAEAAAAAIVKLIH